MASNLIMWIVIFAVVIIGIIAVAVIFSVFGAEPVYLGPSCAAEPTFVCHQRYFSFETSGVYDTLNASIGQLGVSTLYNLQIACVSSYSGTDGAIVPVPASAWQTISASGQAFQNGGVYSTALDLGPEEGIAITGLRCYNQTGVALANEPNGSVYTGVLLANFSSVRCDDVPCSWQQLKIAAFSLRIIK
ncbi:MAG: hypothetical protein LVQ95_03840 [Candidatus Micrarchaeales archaeon]|nr:hypothetical protein [Candidatus Micrarchaeales archaeon]